MESLADIAARLPKAFTRRLFRLAKSQKTTPEHVLNGALSLFEAQARGMNDQEMMRKLVSEFHRGIARKTAQNLGEVGRLVRARRAAEGRLAKAAGVPLEKFLAKRAKAADMTVQEYLERPKKQ